MLDMSRKIQRRVILFLRKLMKVVFILMIPPQKPANSEVQTLFTHFNVMDNQFRIQTSTDAMAVSTLNTKEQLASNSYNITPESHIKVTRMKEMFTNLRGS